MASFEALMALASKQTEASQIALEKETQIRQAREKSKRMEEERKEKERIRIEKERLAKQKLEDEKREQRLLEERQRKQAERLSLAEAARKQQELNSTNPSSSSRVNNRPNSNSKPRPAVRASSSTPGNQRQDPEEQRMLEREEKKARARARLFGEPVSAHKKQKPVTTRVGSNQRLNTNSKTTAPLRGTAVSNKSHNLSASSTPLTARQRIEQQFSASERKPLNQVKKDRRTIEEIEQDMQRKKVSPFAETSALSRKTQELSLEFNPERKVPSPLKSAINNSVFKVAQRSPRPISESASTVKRKLSGSITAPPSKRPLGSSGLPRTSHEVTSHKVIDSHRSASGSKLPPPRPPSHSNRNLNPRVSQSDEEDSSESEEISDQDAPVAPSIRDEIWKIMGKDRKQYTTKPIFSDEEGSDDMEADIDDVLEEEGRAARLARLEDQREEERLRQHELEKKKRLLQNRMSK